MIQSFIIYMWYLLSRQVVVIIYRKFMMFKPSFGQNKFPSVVR